MYIVTSDENNAVCEPLGVPLREDLYTPFPSLPAVGPKEQGGQTRGLGRQGTSRETRRLQGEGNRNTHQSRPSGYEIKLWFVVFPSQSLTSPLCFQSWVINPFFSYVFESSSHRKIHGKLFFYHTNM